MGTILDYTSVERAPSPAAFDFVFAFALDLQNSASLQSPPLDFFFPSA
jgi:hypothetical protein